MIRREREATALEYFKTVGDGAVGAFVRVVSRPIRLDAHRVQRARPGVSIDAQRERDLNHASNAKDVLLEDDVVVLDTLLLSREAPGEASPGRVPSTRRSLRPPPASPRPRPRRCLAASSVHPRTRSWTTPRSCSPLIRTARPAGTPPRTPTLPRQPLRSARASPTGEIARARARARTSTRPRRRPAPRSLPRPRAASTRPRARRGNLTPSRPVEPSRRALARAKASNARALGRARVVSVVPSRRARARARGRGAWTDARVWGDDRDRGCRFVFSRYFYTRARAARGRERGRAGRARTRENVDRPSARARARAGDGGARAGDGR